MSYKTYDPDVLKRVQSVELDLIKKFKSICEANDIKYFAVFGTAIGAVRHNGFIPWDDDADFGMLRSEYEKFKAVMDSQDFGEYKLAGPDCEKKYFGLMNKFYKANTVFKHPYNSTDDNLGIYIDIFIFDGLADDKKDRRNQLKRADFLHNLHLVRNVDFIHQTMDKEGKLLMRIATGIGHRLLKLIPKSESFIYNKWLKNSVRYGDNTRYVTQFSSSMPLESSIFREDLNDLIEVEFEDITIPIPRNYDDMLLLGYGDYMTLPPLEKRQNHRPERIVFEDGTEIL